MTPVATSETDAVAATDFSSRYVLYAIAIVFLVSVFNVVDRYILSVLAPSMQRDLTLSDTQMGWLLGPSFSVVHFLFVLPAAWLADRTSRRTIVALGLFVWSGMTALGASAQSFGQFFLTRMGVGIGEAAGSPPSVGLLADTAPPEWRTRALASITVGALVGVAVGMIAGGYLGERFGWRTALLAVGLPGTALALVVRFTLREPPRRAGTGASPLAAVRHLFGHASFRNAVLAVSIANIAIAGRSLWEPSFLVRSYGLAGAELGAVYVAISALPSALGALVGATYADRLAVRDPRWLCWICGGSIALGAPWLVAFLLWPADDLVVWRSLRLPVAFLFAATGSFFLGFFSPPMASLAQALATPRMRSLAHAIWTMPYTLVGMGLGPLVVGSTSQALQARHGDDSLRYALVATSLLLPLAALLYFWSARSLGDDLARSERLTARDDEAAARRSVTEFES